LAYSFNFAITFLIPHFPTFVNNPGVVGVNYQLVIGAKIACPTFLGGAFEISLKSFDALRISTDTVFLLIVTQN